MITSAVVVQVAAIDPNKISGTKGNGANQVVPVNQKLDYLIEFANDPNAQAPAQTITITLYLDPWLDWSTFRVGDYGFSDMAFSVSTNSSFMTASIPLAGQPDYEVIYTVRVNQVTGLIAWTFFTIDKDTEDTPNNPTIGLLPPDDGTGIGVGFVRYSVRPREDAPTGTVVNAMATIVFDQEPPLNTNTHFNTLDSGEGLTSSIETVDEVVSSEEFVVSWSGETAENGSGIRDYTVYVSTNDGPYEMWLLPTTLTSAPFVGSDGNHYTFVVVATDNAGNVQQQFQAGQTVLVDISSPTSRVTALPAAINTTSFPVSWTGEDGGSGIASYTVYVSVNGGAYSVWLADTSATSATFEGVHGNIYRFYTLAKDQAGNVQLGPEAPAVIQVDTVAPTSRVPSLTTYSTANIAISWTGEDTDSGIASYTVYVSVNGGAFVPWLTNTTTTSAIYPGEEGKSYRFYTLAKDQAGNVQGQPESIATTLVDTIAPTSRVSLLPVYQTTTNFTVSWTGEDSVSGVASYSVFVSMDGGDYQIWLTNTTATSAIYPGIDGRVYRFYSLAKDQAGNEQTQPEAVQTVQVDTSAPTSRVHSLPNFSTETIHVAWSGEDGGSGIANYSIYVSANGQPFEPWLQHTTATSAIFEGVDGVSYRFYSLAQDRAGNSQTTPEEAVSTLVDVTPPTSRILPLPSFVTEPSFVVQWTGEDQGAGLARYTVLVSIEGGDFTAWLEETESTSAIYQGTEGKTYSFIVLAIDRAGNWQTVPAPAQTTTVDSTSPISSVTVNASVTMNPNFTVSWHGSDVGTRITTFQIYVSIDGGDYALWHTAQSAGQKPFKEEILRNYSFYSIAIDGANNSEQPPTTADATVFVLSSNVGLRRVDENIELIDTQSGQILLTRRLDDPTPLVIEGSDDLPALVTLNFASGGEFGFLGGFRFDAGSGPGDRLVVLGHADTQLVMQAGTVMNFTVNARHFQFTGMEVQEIDQVRH